ncbi:IPT/TIG domain-containing protein [Nitrospirillum iridis]|uniref:IPT/TIG domain-containing protein n=1 Tax=Nitrospirillum iridis TaxID=765888 RepID=A0A7X0AZS8_9PROT|nr:IPT/TIG domain-containing protein [Nitrospirillum iridis]MBB6253162.1 hypothetical protein [Nitrospirillum iridis]
MAVITNSTFDPLKARCNVRLQQGVPIVDADWNELDDIRKFELRAFLKWYVGDGIPDGSDGFRIDATGATDDFIIRAGVAPAAPGTTNYAIALRNTGRCIADGLDVLIQADISYKGQALFTAPGPDGAPKIQPIPVLNGNVLVYLDISERLVTAQEDPSLVLSGLGTESCARMRREWCVRTRVGTTIPAPGDTDFIAGHVYYGLAVIARQLITPTTAVAILQTAITDIRHKGLSISALEKRLAKLESLLLLPAFSAPGGQLVPKTGLVGNVVKLEGRNFNIGTPTVTFGNIAAVLSAPPTSGEVAVVVPNLPNGVYTVSISTDGGGPVTSVDHFTVLGGGGGGPVNGPTLDPATPFVPKSGPKGQNVVITGTNFNQPGLAVSFGVTPAVIVNSSATQITVTVPTLVAGPYTITVNTSAGAIASATPFNAL